MVREDPARPEVYFVGLGWEVGKELAGGVGQQRHRVICGQGIGTGADRRGGGFCPGCAAFKTNGNWELRRSMELG